MIFPFNRTSLELKLDTFVWIGFSDRAFNRTSLELKQEVNEGLTIEIHDF